MGFTNSKHEHEYKYLGMTRMDIVLDVLLCRCTLLMHPGVSSILIHNTQHHRNRNSSSHHKLPEESS